MKFGIAFANVGPFATGDGATGFARAAEEAGFTSLTVMDHFLQIPQVGREWEDLPECFTTLGYLAGATTSVRLGSLVAAVTHRNVGLLPGERGLAAVGVLGPVPVLHEVDHPDRPVVVRRGRGQPQGVLRVHRPVGDGGEVEVRKFCHHQ